MQGETPHEEVSNEAIKAKELKATTTQEEQIAILTLVTLPISITPINSQSF